MRTMMTALVFSLMALAGCKTTALQEEMMDLEAVEQAEREAKEARERARFVKADTLAKDLFTQGEEAFQTGVGEKVAGDYDAAYASYVEAKKRFDESYDEAMRQTEGAAAALQEDRPLPAHYVVREIPERRDCLWRIAEYPFVYGDPWKWPTLHEANMKILEDRKNPHLIYPGQILAIPSLSGKVRSGTWKDGVIVSDSAMREEDSTTAVKVDQQ